MPSPLAGVVIFTVNGRTYRIAGDVTYGPGGYVNESVIGPVGIAAYSRKARAGFIELESTDGADVSLAELQAMTGATVQLVLANGKSITLDGAAQVGEIDANTGEGKFSMRWESDAFRELV